MNKQTLEFLTKFLGTNNPKFELNFALVDFDNRTITATDTKTLAIVHIPFTDVENCKGTHLVHKKVLKVMEALATKDLDYKFKDDCLILEGIKISLDNYYHPIGNPFRYPDISKVLETKFNFQFDTDCLKQIDFELAKSDTFILSSFFNPIIKLTGIPNYTVFYNKQDYKENTTGMVKIVANDSEKILFEVIYMGILYEPMTDNQSVMDFK